MFPYLFAFMGIISNGNAFAQAKYIIEVSDHKFTPDELEISAGDTVEWKNIQGWHNVNGMQGTFPNNPESFGNNTGNNWTYRYVFKTPGKYDYHCDPHAGMGMVGKIEVKTANDDDHKHVLTIQFSGMNLHNNQKLYLVVYEKDSGKEVERKTEDISEVFAVTISGIEKDHSYNIDFFADHNGNNIYDAPPADHAWRLELNNVAGDTTLNFSHNPNFTDIQMTTGITNIESIAYNMYPNPAADKVTLELEPGIENVSVSVFDLTGKMHQLIQHKTDPGVEIDVTPLKQSIYFIQLNRNNSLQTFKLIKR